jgi:hypothetical protein
MDDYIYGSALPFLGNYRSERAGSRASVGRALLETSCLKPGALEIRILWVALVGLTLNISAVWGCSWGCKAGQE